MNRILPMGILCIGSLFIWNISPAYACSGGTPSTIQSFLEYADYTIEAVVVEADDLGQNVIVRVERYLTGGAGSEYLLIDRLDPIHVTQVMSGRSPGGDCLNLVSELSPTDRFYAFVHRQSDGSYRLLHSLWNDPYFQLNTEEATGEIFLEGDENGYAAKGSGVMVNETEFIEIIAQESGEIPVAPLSDTHYPLYAPLRIEAGSSYMLPVDFGDPVPITPDMELLYKQPLGFELSDAGDCDVEGCVQLSPDRLNITVQRDEETIGLVHGVTLQGQASLFSQTSDALAVWQECTLTIYSTGYSIYWQLWIQPQIVNNIPLNSAEDDCSVFRNLAAWSSNGRFLAYTDAEGIWLWDAFSELQPELLLESENDILPLVRYFSPLSRYLAVSVEDNHYTLDTRTGEEFPDGIISPNDRILLSFDTIVEVSDLQICALTPFDCHSASGMYIEKFGENGEREFLAMSERIYDVLWITSTHFLTFTCVEDICAVFDWKPWQATGWQNPELRGYGQHFDYDVFNRQLAITDNTTITIDNHILDMPYSLDGDIQNVEWMQSLFYRER